MEVNVRGLIAERDWLMRECQRLGCVVFPSLANFFLLQPPASVPARDIYQTLIEKHRLVVRYFPGRPGLENLLRITVGLPKQNETFLTALTQLLP